MNHSNLIIELFSGSKTVSGVFEKKGWHSFTVDNDPGLKAQLCCDLLNLHPGQLPHSASFIWASVPCTEFSRASQSVNWQKITKKYRIYEYFPLTESSRNAVDLLQKSVDIIKLYPGIPFIIENPVGRIQHMQPLKNLGHYRYFVNYFDFGFSYSKETYLFSNIWLPFSTKKYKVAAPGLRTIRNVQQRSKVPPLLIEEIFAYLQYGSNKIRSFRKSSQ